MKYVEIGGQTYPHRQQIKSLGLRWNGKSKVWYGEVNEERLAALADLRGLIISTDNGEVDTRTHKQKYGQCEDAPCCGCCGNNY